MINDLVWLPLTVFVALLAGCGAAAPPAAVTPDPEPEMRAPTTAIELVRLLEAIATSRSPGTLEDHVDAAFAERQPSSDELATLFALPPEGCVPVLAEGPGYTSIAIPPPMNDEGEQEVHRIEAIIAELSAAREVVASCDVMMEVDGELAEQEIWLYAVAVRRGEGGVFRAMAWRNFLSEDSRILSTPGGLTE